MVLGALVIMFIVTRILPGDPVMMILGPAHASPENIASMRKLMGLDHSVPVQFVIYLGQLLRGHGRVQPPHGGDFGILSQ